MVTTTSRRTTTATLVICEQRRTAVKMVWLNPLSEVELNTLRGRAFTTLSRIAKQFRIAHAVS